MYSFILLNGGKGIRSGLDYPKQFHLIDAHPMMAYSLIAASAVDNIKEILVNYPEGHLEKTQEICANYVSKDKEVRFVPCGNERQESVRLLLEQAKYENIILHESARPAIEPSWLKELIVNKSENLTYVLPLSFSVAEVDVDKKQILKLLDRNKIFNIQLPQKFEKNILIKAHDAAKAQGRVFTEDATLSVEMLSEVVGFLEGRSTNIKVTSNDDFMIVQSILRGLNKDV